MSDNFRSKEYITSGRLIFLLLVLLLLVSAQTSADQSPAVSDTSPIAGGAEQSPPEVGPNNDDDGKESDEEDGWIKETIEEEGPQIADPLYPWNNLMYHVNDKLYFWVLKPVSKGYSAVVPEDFRIAVSNFFYNLAAPVRFVSSILQLKMKTAGNELIRFVYNTTAGVGGLAEAAKPDLNIPRRDEDLGQTLGKYGIGQGFYIVWPLLGPSSLRDTVGWIGDKFLDPVTYVNPWEASAGITAYDEVNDTSIHIGDYEDLKESAVDPYIAIRDAYTQYRKKKVEE